MRSDAAPLGGETGLAQQTQRIRVREQDPHRRLEAFGVVLLEAPNGRAVEIEQPSSCSPSNRGTTISERERASQAM